MYRERMFDGGNIILLPLVRKEKIKELIYQFDGVFENSVVARPNFEDALDKITNKASVLIAVYENEIVGFCAFYINDFVTNTVYISLIAVDEGCQGNHIGSLMIDYVKSAARINGFNKIRLEVDSNNTKGIIFYNHNAFNFERVASESSKYMVCNL